MVRSDSDLSFNSRNRTTSDSEASSDSEATSDSEVASDIEEINFKGKRPKKNPTFKEKNKRLRQMGKSYLTYKHNEVGDKKLLANPCIGKTCNNCCNSFTEDERDSLFRQFWSLTTNIQKHSYINGCVNVVPIKRKRTSNEISRRSLTYQYFFMSRNVQRRVCLQFFLNTLNITQKPVRKSIEGKIKENTDLRGKHVPKHKITVDQIKDFRYFIESLPAVPSTIVEVQLKSYTCLQILKTSQISTKCMLRRSRKIINFLLA